MFKINKIIYSTPITYKIKDLNDEEIKGGFYKEELMLSTWLSCWKSDKKKGDKVCVKWLGFDNSHNSWIDKKNVVS